MEQRLADMKNSKDECIQEAQEAWQGAITRASEAEERAMKLEKTVAILQEQLHVDQIHRQLWVPDQSKAPAGQVVQSSSGDTLMEEPAGQVGGNSSHDTSMEEPASDERNSNRRSNDDDTDMSEVNIMF